MCRACCFKISLVGELIHVFQERLCLAHRVVVATSRSHVDTVISYLNVPNAKNIVEFHLDISCKENAIPAIRWKICR